MRSGFCFNSDVSNLFAKATAFGNRLNDGSGKRVGLPAGNLPGKSFFVRKKEHLWKPFVVGAFISMMLLGLLDPCDLY